jgi:hypothetical protein
LTAQKKRAKVDFMEIIVLDSACKHHISDESIEYCLLHFLNDLVIDDFPLKRVFVGFDHTGTALEIIAIEDEEVNRMYVIHAMKITKQYYYLLEEGERYEH